MIVQYYPDLDIIDAGILYFLTMWASSAKSEKITDNGDLYVWISPNLIINQMPILKINTERGISKRLDKLIAIGAITRHPNNKSMRRSYFKLNIKNIYFDSDQSNDTIKPTQSQVYEYMRCSIGDEAAQTESQLFVNHYNSFDWRKNGQEIKKWQPLAASWIIRSKSIKNATNTNSNKKISKEPQRGKSFGKL